MRKFHHIGLIARQPVAGENYYELIKVWGTDPSKDPNQIEWVRFKPDSPLANTPVSKMASPRRSSPPACGPSAPPPPGSRVT